MVAAALLALIVTMPLGTGPSSETAGNPVDAMNRWFAAQAGREVGQVAPGLASGAHASELGLTDVNGLPVSLGEFRGRPLWIFFWTTWCPACREEMPDVIDASTDHRAEGLQVIAINWQEDPETVRRHIQETGPPYLVALDPAGRASATFGVLGVPSHYFIDSDGVIRARAFGRLQREQMEAYLAQILE